MWRSLFGLAHRHPAHGVGTYGTRPYSANKADYAAAEEMLSAIRPYVKTFDNYAYNQMPLKEFCIAVTWGPDGLLAMSGAEEANTGVELEFSYHQETARQCCGLMVW